MMNNIKFIFIVVFTTVSCTVDASTGIVSRIRQRLSSARVGIPTDFLDGRVLDEALNFEDFGKYDSYSQFSKYVSNNWQAVLANFGSISTNSVDRFLLLGVGKQFSERFYIDFISELCVLQTNNVITARELDWARASTRYDLNSCIIRRYRETDVISLVNSLKKINPARSSYWDDILSGKRYTNYLHEVEAGLWGPVRQDLP